MADPASSKARRERVTQALANPAFFAEVYFRPYDPNWSEQIPQFGIDMLRFMATVNKGVCMLPPEFMKTTLAQVYALWRTARAATFGQMLRGMLMSEEEDMAKANLAVLRWHIENNERLIGDFWDDKAGLPLLRRNSSIDQWRDDSLLLERAGVSRDPTWQAKGLDSKGIHGRRLDVFIGDDLVTPINAESPAHRKRALDTMDLKVETRVVASGQMLVLANFNDDKDLPSTLAKRKRWSVFRRPSLHVPGQPETAPKDTDLHDRSKVAVTWPENWSYERLIAEFEEKPMRFRRIHLLDPRAEMGERLSTSWLRQIEPTETPLRYCRYYIGIDPAPGGETDDLDFFNITVLALSALNADVVESYNVRASTPRQCALVGIAHDRYQRLGLGVVAIGISKVALDGYFRGALQIARPDLTHKVVPISTPGSKEVRLEGLGPFASTGWLRFWRPVLGAVDRDEGLTSDLADRHQELSLFEEWRDFPFGRHDDRLDGLDMGIRTAQEFGMVGDTEFELEVAEA